MATLTAYFFLHVGDCVGLMLRSRLELNEMVHHPLFTVIFLLEYVVNIPVSQPELPAGKKARSKVRKNVHSHN